MKAKTRSEAQARALNRLWMALGHDNWPHPPIKGGKLAMLKRERETAAVHKLLQRLTEYADCKLHEELKSYAGYIGEFKDCESLWEVAMLILGHSVFTPTFLKMDKDDIRYLLRRLVAAIEGRE